ncbi:unnamed protein product [Notodromas monacha]|uniref:Inositol-tetrakisphosphate 1-kinase N-terminal domain-containing protein n=1 Tax=Notodromas monacha TaxID=399045 RepID=A0A7R9GDD8_9CRUS|nr:unnamed protein product [Notodromas monacha]CAG0917072.1 unnamed protein product [Notodromas monacha]
MSTPGQKLVGYWLPERKKQKLDLDGVAQILRRSNVEFREIDVHQPLVSQGPFDVIVHKLDSMLPTTDEDGEKIETVLKGFEDYCAKYDVELLEALGPGDVLRDRLAMCHLLAEVSSGMKGVFTPPFALLVRPDVNENRQILKEAGVSFPCGKYQFTYILLFPNC